MAKLNPICSLIVSYNFPTCHSSIINAVKPLSLSSTVIVASRDDLDNSSTYTETFYVLSEVLLNQSCRALKVGSSDVEARGPAPPVLKLSTAAPFQNNIAPGGRTKVLNILRDNSILRKPGIDKLDQDVMVKDCRDAD